MGNLSHLDELEAEAIYIMREVAAECEKPVMLYSCWQMFYCGPLARFLFRHIFRRGKQ